MKLTTLISAALLLAALPATAQQMNYQGRLTDASGDPLADGQYTLEFSLWTAATGGDQVWGPYVLDGTTGNGKGPRAELVNGRFNAVLGAVDTANQPLSTSFSGGTRYLQIKVAGAPPVSPRQQVLAAPTALHATIADSVKDGSIVTDSIANGSITAEKLAGGTGTWLVSGNAAYRVNGNVGIGTSTPQERLQVGNYDGSNYISVTCDNLTASGGGKSGIKLRTFNSNWGGNVEYDEVLYGLNFYGVSNGQKIPGLFIDRDSGRVGINTTSPHPAARLNVNGNVRVDGSLNCGFLSGNTAEGLYISPGVDAFGSPSGSGYIRLRNGNIGIGVDNPTRAKLEIASNTGNVSYTHAPGTIYTYGQLTTAGAGTAFGNNGTPTIFSTSLYASGDIVAANYRAVSDARTKRIGGLSSGSEDLAALRQVRVTNYTYVDTIARGAGPQKKVIAQQVEKVYPQAVSKSTDVVPDIFRKAALADGWVQLSTDLKPGERVRLIGDKEEGIHEVLEVKDGAFRTAFQPANKEIFVYGREVNDFRTVDYEAIAMLNVSATQELALQLEAEKADTLAKDREIAALKERLADLEAKDAARDAKLAALVKFMEDRTGDAKSVTVSAVTTKK